MADGESLSDEEMRKLLKPCPTDENVRAILQQHFSSPNDSSFRIVRQLDSYDDCNYQVEINEETFLLKIHNGVESKDYLSTIQPADGNYFHPGSSSSVIHLQNAILWTLTLHGITTSLPVLPNEQQKSSPVAMHSVPVVSPSHSPAPLAVRLLRWVPGHPMSSTKDPIAIETLAEAGRLLGRMNIALDTLTQPAAPVSGGLQLAPHIVAHVHNNASLLTPARRYHQWDGKNIKDLRGFVQYIGNEVRRRMVESVIDAFVADTAGVKFRTGINQGDFNDANIMMEGSKLTGVIDFGDSLESWRVLDVAVAMAYAMLSSFGKQNRSIAAAAAILRGYHAIYPLTEEEQMFLPLLIACRLSCSVTLGAFSLAQNPENTYLLLHAEPAWEALDLVWGTDLTRREATTTALHAVFAQACQMPPLANATEGADTKNNAVKSIPCHDISTPDPCIPDLLRSIRSSAH